MQSDLDLVVVPSPTEKEIKSIHSFEGNIFDQLAQQAERARQGKGFLSLDSLCQSVLVGTGDETILSMLTRSVNIDEISTPSIRKPEEPVINVPQGSLIVVGGSPGSGKSTFTKNQVDSGIPLRILDVDEKMGYAQPYSEKRADRAHRLCLEEADIFLSSGQTVARELTLVSPLRRWESSSLARKHQRSSVLIVIDINEEECLKRIERRVSTGGHGVPEDIAKEYLKRWKTSMLGALLDGFDSIWVISDKEDASGIRIRLT